MWGGGADIKRVEVSDVAEYLPMHTQAPYNTALSGLKCQEANLRKPGADQIQ